MKERTDIGIALRMFAAIGVVALIAFGFAFREDADAATAQTVTLDVQINIGYDSANQQIDSVVFRSKHRRANNTRWTWLGKGAKCVLSTASDNSTTFTDSLCWDVEVSIDSLESYNSDYAWLPSITAWVYWTTGRGITREPVDITPVVFVLDSLDQAISASVSDADWAVGMDSMRTEHGTGAYNTSGGGLGGDTLTLYVYNSADSTGIGSARVWMYPNDGGTRLEGTSDANGRLQFGAANDTLLGFAWVSGWFQASPVPDTYIVISAIADTLFMTQTTPASPAAANLTAITFTFFEGDGDSLQDVSLYYTLSSPSATNYHYDSTKLIDPAKVWELRSDSSGQVTINVIPTDSIYTDGYQTDKVRWHVWATSPRNGDQLLGADGIKIRVPGSAAGLSWPKDF